MCRRLEEAGIAFRRSSLSLGTDLRDFDQTLSLFLAVRPTTVLNCASFSGGIQFGLKYPADIFRNNMPMIANLVRGSAPKPELNASSIRSPTVSIQPSFTLFEESRFWDGPLHESVHGLRPPAQSVLGRFVGLCTPTWATDHQPRAFEHVRPGRSLSTRSARTPSGALVRKFIEAKKSGAQEVIVWGTGTTGARMAIRR